MLEPSGIFRYVLDGGFEGLDRDVADAFPLKDSGVGHDSWQNFVTLRITGASIPLPKCLFFVSTTSIPLPKCLFCVSTSLSRACAFSSFSLAPYSSFANIQDNSKIKAKKDYISISLIRRLG